MTKDFIIATNENNNNNKNNAVCKKPPSYSKKGSRAMNIIRVALYMLRKNNKGGGKANKSAMITNSALKRLMGSVRPLNYIQDGVGGMSSPPPSSSPPPPPANVPLTLPLPSSDCGRAEGGMVSQEDVLGEMVSPVHAASLISSSSRSSSSVGGMSRYASAQSLYDLDNHDENDDEENDVDDDGDAYYDGLEGDDMIDAKAEMFIAKFYQQMRLQD